MAGHDAFALLHQHQQRLAFDGQQVEVAVVPDADDEQDVLEGSQVQPADLVFVGFPVDLQVCLMQELGLRGLDSEDREELVVGVPPGAFVRFVRGRRDHQFPVLLGESVPGGDLSAPFVRAADLHAVQVDLRSFVDGEDGFVGVVEGELQDVFLQDCLEAFEFSRGFFKCSLDPRDVDFYELEFVRDVQEAVVSDARATGPGPVACLFERTCSPPRSDLHEASLAPPDDSPVPHDLHRRFVAEDQDEVLVVLSRYDWSAGKLQAMVGAFWPSSAGLALLL